MSLFSSAIKVAYIILYVLIKVKNVTDKKMCHEFNFSLLMQNLLFWVFFEENGFFFLIEGIKNKNEPLFL